jgi:transcriptional regulator with XRE-family HTH domain
VSLTSIVAKNLKRTRLRRKLSQQALAAEVGLSTSYVSMLERGQRSPPLLTIEQFAEALGVKPLDLLRARG